MDDGSISAKKAAKSTFVSDLKNEWSLFWEGLIGEDDEDLEVKKLASRDPFVNGKLEILTLEQIKVITKALSSDRKKLNQRLEMINKEIEENTAKIESLKLVGGETEEALQRIGELTDLGQQLSDKLAQINDRLKIARQREDEIKNANEI